MESLAPVEFRVSMWGSSWDQRDLGKLQEERSWENDGIRKKVFFSFFAHLTVSNNCQFLEQILLPMATFEANNTEQRKALIHTLIFNHPHGPLSVSSGTQNELLVN